MTTFDDILPITVEVLTSQRDKIAQLEWLLVNRDLNGRVRLIAPEQQCRESEAQRTSVEAVYQSLSERLAPHTYSTDVGILYETSQEVACQGVSHYVLNGLDNVRVVDRLATEANWVRIEPESQSVPRIVFFSIKGGVGRSTALAATAWSLAQAGKRVLVLDLDLESPGLSSALLPRDRQPRYGITDWLVEDLVDNADTIFDSMIASSNLSHDGEIHVVPAHGAIPGEHIAKLGRVWMPKVQADGAREPWPERLERLLQALEERVQPDVVLIDSRSGIDEIASACITGMGAILILLFALEGEQTWNGYRMLFDQWRRAGVAQEIRERLQMVGAIVPEQNQIEYLKELREHSYEIFVDTLYDEIAPNKTGLGPDGTWQVGNLSEGRNFDEADEGAPHYPWAVNWHRSFAGLRSLYGRLSEINTKDMDFIFGPLLNGLKDTLDLRKTS